MALSRLPLGDDARYWVASFRGERRASRWPWLSGFLEGTLAVLDAPPPPPGQAPSEIPPWIDAFPLFGSRIYLPIAQGGLVLTQGLGLSVVSVSAPGSVAADLHFGGTYVLPELRWDPTFHGIDGARGFLTITGILYIGQRF